MINDLLVAFGNKILDVPEKNYIKNITIYKRTDLLSIEQFEFIFYNLQLLTFNKLFKQYSLKIHMIVILTKVLVISIFQSIFQIHAIFFNLGYEKLKYVQIHVLNFSPSIDQHPLIILCKNDSGLTKV